MDLAFRLELALFIILLGFSGFFSGSETAQMNFGGCTDRPCTQSFQNHGRNNFHLFPLLVKLDEYNSLRTHLRKSK